MITKDCQLDERILAGLHDLALENGLESVQELIGMFLDGTPERLRRLAAAINARDAHGLEAMAHKLRGSAASFGASEMAKLCHELEALGSGGSVQNADQRLGLVAAEFERAAVALRTEFRIHPAEVGPTGRNGD